MAVLSRKALNPDELEMDQMAEAELNRLQRQYRIMEGDRAAYSEEMKFLLSKQKKMMLALEEEKKELSLNIKVINSSWSKRIDNHTTTKLRQLYELQKKYDADLRKEKTQLAELERQIKKVVKEIAAFKKKDISDNTYQEKEVASQKAVKMLENRLDNVSIKFNKTLAENAVLREEIDHLLKERGRFNTLYQQLINRIINGKKCMGELIDQATQAYDHREEAQAKLQALQVRGTQEHEKHSQEMRELHRRYDHDSKLEEFLSTKGQKRTMAELEAKEAQKKISLRENMERMINTYQNLLEQIKEFCGESDIDKLAAQFVKQEEENFALFNYVNELNCELEVLQEQVDEMEEKMEEQKGTEADWEQRQEETITELQDELKKNLKENEEAKKNLIISENILENLLFGIGELFRIMNCDNAPILELLGKDGQVTMYSVMLYLGILEKRVNELVSVLYYAEKKRNPEIELGEDEETIIEIKDFEKQKTPSELVAEVPCSLCLEQQNDAIEDNDEDPEPMSHAETKMLLLKSIDYPETQKKLHDKTSCKAPLEHRMFQR